MHPTTSATLQTVLEALRERLARRPEVLEAYLFGSHARQSTDPVYVQDAI